MNADIDDYIEASLKYIAADGKKISNTKIPNFSYETFLDDENDVKNDYRFRLKEWIINKKNSDEKFIPVIDRIDLNEERKIKAFDQTEDNSQKIFPISNITIKLKKGD
ncbi:MAG: hypothetical protein K1X86_12855 [Ignavibacteria bacterium]|nr:hypothetical protein [Ignavibacteria bacterium]